MSRWAKAKRNRDKVKTSKLLVNKETYTFLAMQMPFLIKIGMVPKFVYSNNRNFLTSSDLAMGIPRVVHKQDRIELHVSPEFKTRIVGTMRRERCNLYDAIYLTVIELAFSSSE